MSRSNSLRRGAAALVLLSALSLARPLTADAQPSIPARQVAVHAQHSGFLHYVWHLLTSLWGREGGTMDPTGKPKP
jgi:hypothetical protein